MTLKLNSSTFHISWKNCLCDNLPMRRSVWSNIASFTLLALVVLPPLLALLVGAVSQRTSGTSLPAALAGQRQIVLLGRSLLIAVAAGGGSALLGLALGGAISAQSPVHQHSMLTVMLLPLLIPPFIHSLSWIMLFDSMGQSLHGMAATIGVLSVAFCPLAGLLSWVGLRQLRSVVEPASLVRSRLAILLQIELPLLLPYLITGFVLVFLFSFSEYAVPSLFRVNTYPVTVFAQFAAYYDVRGAVLASWPYLLVPLAALAFWRVARGERVLKAIGRDCGQHTRVVSSRERLVWGIVFSLIIGLGGLLPVAIQLLKAGGYESYVVAWRTAHRQIINSVLLSGITATVLLLVSTVIAVGMMTDPRRGQRLFDFLSLLPVAIPGTIFGVGMITLWNHSLTQGIYGTVLVVGLLHAARFIPFVLRPIMAQINRVGKDLYTVASLTDAPPLSRFFRIRLPLLAPSLLVGWALCFILSLRELTGTLLVTPPGFETLGVRIYSLYHYGAGNLVAALTVFMVAITMLVFVGVTWLYKKVQY